MENLKDPGIAIEHIRLLQSHVKMVDSKGKPEYNLILTALSRHESQDGKILDIQAAFNMMHGIDKPIFNFTCEFFARYTRQDDAGMAWKDFTSAMALAHIIPYLREYVSNITNRMPTPILMLNPINTHAMIAEYEDRIRQAEQAKTEKRPVNPEKLEISPDPTRG